MTWWHRLWRGKQMDEQIDKERRFIWTITRPN
jgi:hypothetical protein